MTPRASVRLQSAGVIAALAAVAVLTVPGCSATSDPRGLPAAIATAPPEDATGVAMSYPDELPKHGPAIAEARIWRSSVRGGSFVSEPPGRYIVDGCDLADLVSGIYNVPLRDIEGIDDAHEIRIGYEIVGIGSPASQLKVLAAMAPEAFGFRAEVVTFQGDIVTLSRQRVPKIRQSGTSPPVIQARSDSLLLDGATSSTLCSVLDDLLGMRVVDRSALKGRYFVKIALPEGSSWKSPNALDAIEAQTGLRLQRSVGELRKVVITWP